jgi:hypothetical protein
LQSGANQKGCRKGLRLRGFTDLADELQFIDIQVVKDQRIVNLSWHIGCFYISMPKYHSLILATACVLASAASSRADNNLIDNGGFETGDFTGWTATAVSYPIYVTGNPAFVHSGDFAAQIAGYSYGPDTLSQAVTTTMGQSYTLSFWRYINDGNPTTSLVADWDGAPVYAEVDTGPFEQYQEISVNVVGTGSDTLEFLSANDPSETYLDDVSLTANSVPDGGATLSLLGLACTGLAAVRRRSVRS